MTKTARSLLILIMAAAVALAGALASSSGEESDQVEARRETADPGQAPAARVATEDEADRQPPDRPSSPARAARRAPVRPEGRGPFVLEPAGPERSALQLRHLPPAMPAGDDVKDNPHDPGHSTPGDVATDLTDPASASIETQMLTAGSSLTAPLISFAGFGEQGFAAADVSMDVGPNHIVQMVNGCTHACVGVWSKLGAPLLPGSVELGDLWAPGHVCHSDTICADGNRCVGGDPIVQYDGLADRWLLSQFTGEDDFGNYNLCIAVSTGPDPLGTYALYYFGDAQFPDYPKYAVWPDAYYVTGRYTKGTGFVDDDLPIYALNRSAMLAGTTAGAMSFVMDSPQEDLVVAPLAVRGERALVADLDDNVAPPSGAPAIVLRTVENWQDNTTSLDRLEIWEYHVDWVTPANSAMTLVQTFTEGAGLDGFVMLPCSYSDPDPNHTGASRNCIPQPNDQNSSSPIAGVNPKDGQPQSLMNRAPYRNFGSHETILALQTVRAQSGAAIGAGLRWYELRRSGGGAWSIHKQSTYIGEQPSTLTDTTWIHHFMGSIGMDSRGNIAMGYNVSNHDPADPVYPGIRYWARLEADPVGVITQDEQIGYDGSANHIRVSNTAYNRWVDYSSLVTDPDGCTFWYSNCYAGAGNQWTTRIFSFTIDEDFDGVGSACDNCPYVSNAGQNDVDGDGVGDSCDNCPSIYNGGQVDADGDGIGNSCDACPLDPDNDIDGDTVCGNVDNCPAVYNFGQSDTDLDGVGNQCDACPLDPDNDSDGDGVCGDVDNCPSTFNTSQLDTDMDGIGNLCDACPLDPGNDIDGDSLCGNVDNCPSVYNFGQIDTDLDGVGNQCDNCPTVYNDGQLDVDGDGLGNLCDTCPLDPDDDIDGDGVCGNVDNCPSVYNVGQLDVDGDGLGNLCDACDLDPLNDADGDGACGNVDCLPDDGTAFAVPGEVAAVSFTGPSTLAWTDDAPGYGSGTRYDVMRGGVANLPVGSGGEICPLSGTASFTQNVPNAPAPGVVWYFLVRMTNNCANGAWGFDSSAVEQVYAGCDGP